MRRNSNHTLVFGLALAYASLPACTSLTEVDWSRIPPAAVGGTGGGAGTDAGGNAGSNNNTAGTNNTSGSANEAGSPAGGADDGAASETAGAGGADGAASEIAGAGGA